jgi:hypothetical protein
MSVSPTKVVGGASATATVTLTGSAPAGGLVVTLATNNAVATVPASVTVPGGATAATFPVATSSVPVDTVVSISASGGGVTKAATLTVQSLLLSISMPGSVTGGQTASVTVKLNGAAPAGGVVVALATNDPVVGVPVSVTVPAGATQVSFLATTSPVAVNTPVLVSASAGGSTRSTVMTVKAPVLFSLMLSPTAVVGGGSSTGTVRLTGAAPAGGVVVTLAGNHPAATVPESVTVPEGAITATFPITTSPVTADTAVSIAATGGGVTKAVTLTVRR